jgi:uncharacterized protein with ATP-grasp and redox domains
MDMLGIAADAQVNLLKEALQILDEVDDSTTSPAAYGSIQQILKEYTNGKDAYAEKKERSHQAAMGYLEDLREMIDSGPDHLETGLKVSATGNLIDVVHASEVHLWEEVVTTANQDLLGDGLEAFRKRLADAPSLLYLADNVGETVFDRVFIETLDLPVIYAVKSAPIINDATKEDALAAGIDQVAEIVETGSGYPGTTLELCSEEFQKLFEESPLVLAKGQANYETLDDQGEKVFFLLRTKCPLIAEVIGYPRGSLVLKQGGEKN